jgi:hypothetical protein
LADPLLAPYFGDVGMDRQVTKQAAFLARAHGGPGPDRRAAGYGSRAGEGEECDGGDEAGGGGG